MQQTLESIPVAWAIVFFVLVLALAQTAIFSAAALIILVTGRK